MFNSLLIILCQIAWGRIVSWFFLQLPHVTQDWSQTRCSISNCRLANVNTSCLPLSLSSGPQERAFLVSTPGREGDRQRLSLVLSRVNSYKVLSMTAPKYWSTQHFSHHHHPPASSVRRQNRILCGMQDFYMKLLSKLWCSTHYGHIMPASSDKKHSHLTSAFLDYSSIF